MEATPRNRPKKPGASPGSLILTGQKKVQKVKLEYFEFGQTYLKENIEANVDEILTLKNSANNLWINIDGLHETDLIQKIGSHFSIHPLNQEDILDVNSRPKIDEMDEYIFLSFKMLSWGTGAKKLSQEQLSIILGDHWVLSFQELPGDSFDPIRERLRSGKGRMRKMGVDYLAYALIDALVDYYFVIAEEIGERIDTIDKKVLDNPSPLLLKQIQTLKNELVKVRKAIWPLRDIISTLERNDSGLIRSETNVFLRDLNDHIIQLIETIETYRDSVGGLFDIYLSSQSNRTNEVIRLLTVITSIFIPLTFIVGIYGMNFKFFPELNWQYGYPMVWGIMVAIALGMLVFFKKREWI
jgi:magnesium transporter